MDTEYRIADVARRTGFKASTLRYYEEIGLLPAPDRTDAGYRRYDDRDVARLRFVARAKQLGCTLDEIAELLRARDGDRCAPVAARLAGLVAAKRAETAASIAELAGFAVQLQDAAATLAGAPRDEPCGDDCSCMAEAPGDPFLAVPVTLGRSQDTEPIACTLDAREWPERVDEWHRLLAGVRTREPVDGDVRLVFDLGVDASEIARLAGAEQDCCRFFAFALTIDARGLALEVRGELHGPGPG